MNERYQKHTSPSGKTRKSAAAAKPKRTKPDEPARKKSSREIERDKRRESLRKRNAMMHPPTEEYRRMRRIWWVFLGGAIVLSTVAWALWANVDNRNYGNVVLFIAYACMGIAVWIDWSKLRKIRQRWAESKGATPAEKPDKSDSKSNSDKS
jgi:hypothetical protein